jgi:hypothetical protein
VVLGEKLDDGDGRVVLMAARGSAAPGRASRGRTADRASWGDRRDTIVEAKLLDLLLQPSQVLSGRGAISGRPGSHARQQRFGDCPLVDGVGASRTRCRSIRIEGCTRDLSPPGTLRISQTSVGRQTGSGCGRLPPCNERQARWAELKRDGADCSSFGQESSWSAPGLDSAVQRVLVPWNGSHRLQHRFFPGL